MFMTIKHLVFSGGGPIMIQMLGAMEYLATNGFLQMENIESIYGTSAGAIVAVMLSLKFPWQTIQDYIIKRPWQDVFQVNLDHILESYDKKGLFDSEVIRKSFKPLFGAKDLSLDITLEEFYAYSNIDIHLVAFELNAYQTIDISHATFPKLPLLVALQMSIALPIFMAPVCIDQMCVMDGGVACNYPLKYCIERGVSSEEILGFKNQYSTQLPYTTIHAQSTLFDYLLGFMYKSIFNQNQSTTIPIHYELVCDTSYITMELLQNTFSHIELRRELFEKGIETAKQFLELHRSS